MLRVLDCPGIETGFLNRLAIQAAAEFGLRTASEADPAAMRERKRCELDLADVIFVCSELQGRLLRSPLPAQRVHVLPLWTDNSFWYSADKHRFSPSHPLRVLFAGKINVRKGVPYLIRAAITCGVSVVLTLVGCVEDETLPLLKRYEGMIDVVPPCSKVQLRKLYHDHDILVLPSLGDSFGFVAMEAMACGLPVIVTDNCGVPVPDSSWRVPIMDADAIARRLALYATNRSLCREDGLVAARFARQFTPEHYREKVKTVLKQLVVAAAA
jgi:glycosyltransferase involved in cell wall biosynthesis